MKDFKYRSGTMVGKGTATFEDRDGEPESFSLLLLQQALEDYKKEFGHGEVQVRMVKSKNESTGTVQQLLHLTDETEDEDGIFVAPRIE
jgi:hypothetical protein